MPTINSFAALGILAGLASATPLDTVALYGGAASSSSVSTALAQTTLYASNPATPSPCSPPPATTESPTTSTTSTTSAALPTYTINVDVGASSFDAGDANLWDLSSTVGQVCTSNGCDGGAPVNFNYEYISAGYQSSTTGHFTMTGTVNNDQDITNALLEAVQVAFQGSQKCTSVKAQKCAFDKRDSGLVLHGCEDVTLNDCTYVNFITATADIPTSAGSAESASITMQAFSGNPGSFNCGEVFGITEGGSKIIGLSSAFQGLETLAQVICELFSG